MILHYIALYYIILYYIILLYYSILCYIRLYMRTILFWLNEITNSYNFTNLKIAVTMSIWGWFPESNSHHCSDGKQWGHYDSSLPVINQVDERSQFCQSEFTPFPINTPKNPKKQDCSKHPRYAWRVNWANIKF